MEEMLQESSIIENVFNAIAGAPPDLFENFNNIRPILLDRSPISKNRPLYYQIVENFIHFQEKEDIIRPILFPQIKSDETSKVYDDFFNENKKNLEDLDINNVESIQHFLSIVGIKGIRTLIGLRKTVGSYEDILPPCTDKLLSAFNQHHKGQAMTVGARALTKHAIRDSSKFWGDTKGTTEQVNNSAIRCLNHIIENCVWNNVIFLTSGVKAYEIRCNPGYGARWEYRTEDDIEFRGFLEPLIEDGHAKRWRH